MLRAAEKLGAATSRMLKMLGTPLEATIPIRAHDYRASRTGSPSTPTAVSRCRAVTGDLIEKGRVTEALAFRGIERGPMERAGRRDIVAIAGLERSQLSPTPAASLEEDEPLDRPADRPADAVDDHLGQRRPLCRDRGRHR